MGAKKGEVIGMFLPNCVEFPVLFSGATDAGTYIVLFKKIEKSGIAWRSDIVSKLPKFDLF